MQENYLFPQRRFAMKPYFTKSMRYAELIIAIVWSMSFAITDADWSSTMESELNVGGLTIDSSGNIYGNNIYTNSKGEAVSRMAKWNGSTWTLLNDTSISNMFVIYMVIFMQFIILLTRNIA